MFCPQCGTGQPADLKFCKSCGVNLATVRQAVATRDTAQQFDWSKTWVAEMLLSRDEQAKRKRERKGNLYAESMRSKEIKAGVITSFVGIGVMVFLYVLMQGIILSGQNSPGDNEILSRIWIAGVFPFFVGLGLMINGIFVSKRQAEAARRAQHATPGALREGADARAIRSADTSEFITPDYSVTEGTTKHLSSSGPKQ